LLARLTIQEALALLPQDRFTRVHRSFIVANDKIDKVERHQLGISGANVPVGASYLPDSSSIGTKTRRC
jgi:two-component system LytT family response regulator